MKPFLNLIEMEIQSIKSLRLSDERRLVDLWRQVGQLQTVRDVNFFGVEEKLRPLRGIGQLIKEFRKAKPGSYSFADAKDPIGQEAHVYWNVGIRKAFLTITVECDCTPERIVDLSNELLVLNQVLLSAVTDGKAATPFSFLRLPGTRFNTTRPPRFLGKLVPDSIVDIIFLKAQCSRQEEQTVDQFRSRDLPPAAERSFAGDSVVVRWGDVTKQSPAAILAQRYRWLVEGGEFPIHGSYNAAGDKEFALWQPVRTREFTGYSAFDGRATKALMFDKPDEVVDVLEQMHRILTAGRNSSGDPVKEITLIVTSRESALALHLLAQRYGMQVVYVGDDNRLWNPFPSEHEND